MTSTTPKVRVGVGAFVLESAQTPPKNPRFLIGKRINAHGSGTYALPGGHLEFGESPEQCAARELLEETGLKAKNVRFLTATNDYMPADHKHYITMLMVCARENDEDQPEDLEPENCEGWEWVSWDQLVGWAKEGDEARGDDGKARRLFTPIISLLTQRPGVMPSL